MNELFFRLRRMFGVPRKDFVSRLRLDLLEAFENRRPAVEDLLYAVKDIEPSPRFQRALRLRLAAEMAASHRVARSPLVLRFARAVPALLQRSLSATAAVAVALTIIVSSLFFGAVPATQATVATYLVDFAGEVVVTSSGHAATVVTPQLPLAQGTRIETGLASSAEVRFFEDSVVRLDAGTVIEIDALRPHPSRDDLGFVDITLTKGRIWAYGFPTDDRFSRFTLSLAGHQQVVSDSGGVFDASINPYGSSVRVWERSVSLRQGASLILMPEGKKLRLSHSQQTELIPLDITEPDEAWVSANRGKDDLLIAGFLSADRITRGSSAADGSLWIDLLGWGNDPDQEIASLEAELAKIIAAQKQGEDLSPRLSDWSQSVRQVRLQHPQETDAFLAAAEKALSPVLPDEGLFAAKTEIALLRQEFTDLPHIVFTEKLRTDRLWEARRLAESGKLALAESIVRDAAAEQAGADPLATDAAESVLAEKQEQLVVLGEIQKDGVAPAIVTQAEDEIINASSRLLRPAFPDPSPLALAQKAADIVERVERYKSPVGQKNTLRHHLERLGASGENLRLLAEIKQQVPGELAPDVSEQMIAILASEREKVRQTQALPTTLPCVVDCEPLVSPESTTSPASDSPPAAAPDQSANSDKNPPVASEPPMLTPVEEASPLTSLGAPVLDQTLQDAPIAIPAALD